MSEKHTDEKNSLASAVALGLPPDVKKAGVLRKLKTMKKKYFVLRIESDSGPARLEYYDSEKKFKSGGAAKRSIAIKTCFNINRKVDAKQKLAIALYTKDDCFSVVAENELSLDEWLTAMLELQLDGHCSNGSTKLKPKFEHVWQVNVGEKSLACTRNMKGLYRLCLTTSSLTLVKMDQSDNPETLEFPLMSIRRCGHTNNYFLIELGRSSITGAGELWLETEDVVIAQNMHEVTLNAMKSSREHEDMGPLSRPRSASNSENSRPIATRRPFAVVSPQAVAYGAVRDRCDSMPSRPRTISEGQEINNRCYYTPSHPLDSLRSHNSYSRTISYSPPGMPNPLSPGSTACSTDSAGSSLSIDEYDGGPSDFTHGRYSHSLPTDGAVLTEPPIKEEPLDDYIPMAIGGSTKENTGYLHMSPIYSTSAPTGPSLYLNLNPSETVRSNTTSSTSQSSDYMQMKSPTSPPGCSFLLNRVTASSSTAHVNSCGRESCISLEDYIAMSPVGTSTEFTMSKLETGLNTSAASKTSDGYIHMAPGREPSLSTSSSITNDGYLDMAPLSSSLPKTYSVTTKNVDIFNMKDISYNTSGSSVVSSPDVTNSGEFPLDKVKSLLTQTEDTSDDYIRPVRAYSMGSRPQSSAKDLSPRIKYQPKKSHLPIQTDGSRIRAYSVGSQADSARNKNLNPVDRDLGCLKRMDVRVNAKSSSAPLLHNRPPRIRSSASRGDVGEDLMEIDYDKARLLSSGLDLSDKNFTIEPVGRSRSGSCSSSSAVSIVSEKLDRKNKLINERDKAALIQAGQSSNVTHSSLEAMADYLTMSPALESSKSALKQNSGNSAILFKPATNENSMQKKASEHVHPPGDYVSLDPSIKYTSFGGSTHINSIHTIKGNVGVNPIAHQDIASPLSGTNATLVQNTVNPSSIVIKPLPKPVHGTVKPEESSATDSKGTVINGKLPQSSSTCKEMSQNNNYTTTCMIDASITIRPKETSDYMCMSPGATGDVQVESVDQKFNFRSNLFQMKGELSSDMKNAKNIQEAKKESLQDISCKQKCSLPSISQPKGTSVPTSPSRSPATSRASFLLGESCVPKTPPPSPLSGSVTNLQVFSGAPLIASLTRRLSKPNYGSATQSAPNSRPSSVCEELQLNYASLDLPPPVEEDTSIVPIHRVRQSVEAETKEVPLTYAQIDFSTSKKKSIKDAFKESLSHL